MGSTAIKAPGEPGGPELLEQLGTGVADNAAEEAEALEGEAVVIESVLEWDNERLDRTIAELETAIIQAVRHEREVQSPFYQPSGFQGGMDGRSELDRLKDRYDVLKIAQWIRSQR